MRRFCLIVIATAMLCALATQAEADHRFSYPRVRTFSGSYYGPTQANYQYQRRYGRTWHGVGGFSGGFGVGYVNGYPGGGFSSYSGWGGPSCGYQSFGYGLPYSGLDYGLPYSGFGYGYSQFPSATSVYGGFGLYSPYGGSYWGASPYGMTFGQPSLFLQNPGIYSPLPSTNPLANRALLNNGYLWQQEVPDLLAPSAPGVETLDVQPLGEGNVLPQPASTPAAQLRSLQHQQHGDARLRDLDYLQAYLRYEDAVKAAADRAEPHYRMGIALAGMKRFDKAVRELKTATALDPTWPGSVTLLELLGEDNLIGKTQLKQGAADWALADAYDADRLYLLGTLLHLDGDAAKARILFETAAALVGNEQHLAAFLSPSAASGPQGTAPAGPQQVAAPPAQAGQTPPPSADELPEPPPAPQTSPVLPSLTQPPAVIEAPSQRNPQGPVFPTSFSRR